MLIFLILILMLSPHELLTKLKNINVIAVFESLFCSFTSKLGTEDYDYPYLNAIVCIVLDLEIWFTFF